VKEELSERKSRAKKFPQLKRNECCKEIDKPKGKTRGKTKGERLEEIRERLDCDAEERHVAGTSLVLSTECIPPRTSPSSFQPGFSRISKDVIFSFLGSFTIF